MEQNNYNLDPTDDEILQWAKDDGIEFLEQDEDVVFGYHHIPVLIQIINDDSCSKQSFAFSIVGEMIRNSALGNSEKFLIELYQNHFHNKIGSILFNQLSKYVSRLLLHLKSSNSPSFVQAEIMADDLLLGITRTGETIKTERNNDDYWEFLLQTSIREYLCVHKTLGIFHYGRYKSWLD